MPSHWSSPGAEHRYRFVATGTQFVQAVGCAEGACATSDRKLGRDYAGLLRGRRDQRRGILGVDEHGLPGTATRYLFLIEDNGYAISVPVERQTPGGNISQLLAGFPDLLRIEVDGTDFISSYRATGCSRCLLPRTAMDLRLCTRTVTRPYSHSLSDDERYYKTKQSGKKKRSGTL